MIKAACQILKNTKMYDYFKMAYKHDAEHDVTSLWDFYVNTECFLQRYVSK